MLLQCWLRVVVEFKTIPSKTQTEPSKNTSGPEIISRSLKTVCRPRPGSNMANNTSSHNQSKSSWMKMFSLVKSWAGVQNTDMGSTLCPAETHLGRGQTGTPRWTMPGLHFLPVQDVDTVWMTVASVIFNWAQRWSSVGDMRRQNHRSWTSGQSFFLLSPWHASKPRAEPGAAEAHLSVSAVSAVSSRTWR